MNAIPRRRLMRGLIVSVFLATIVSSAGLACAADASLSVQSVDTKDYPTVETVVTVPSSLSDAGKPEFTVTENGEQVDGVVATSLASEASANRVVLVIDTSGSMQGQPLTDAKAAATRFVSSLGEGAQVALIAFSNEPRLVSAFSDQPAVLARAIGSLQAGGETALYDALRAANTLVATVPDSARASIVILSDGGDTVSNAALSEVRSRFDQTGAPVYAVALKSEEYNSRPLELITKSTQGRLVPASGSDGLSALFEGIAKEISSAWRLTYDSSEPRTVDVDVDVVATVGQDSASATFAYRNPALAAAATAPVVFPTVSENIPQLMVIAGLALLAVTLLVIGVLLIALRDRNTLDHLRYYDQLHEMEDLSSGAGGTARVRGAIVDAVDTVAGKRGLTQLASSKLEAAGLPLRPSEYMTIHIASVVGLGLLAQVLSGNLVVSVLVIVVTTVGPLMALEVAADKRRARFDEQLPDVLQMIAGSLRGGWGIQQAIALAADEAAPPMSTELKRVETETRLGMPLERSLQTMADRIESPDFHAAVGAIAIQREVGGNLAEVLDLVAKTVRERDAMRRQVKALTAEGRLSAWILIALPFVVVAILMLTSPSYIVPLFTTAAGILMLVMGLLLLSVGGFWLYRVTKIEV